ncbi:MAG: hypothetical protein FVQ85_05700 [Planctomycetes bacterium]|nr:hypothetical protein [Planctomycetota bacterium]
MRKKGGNIFEEHAEKIVLVIVGLVCMWLLITRVFISPNKVLLYAGVELGPGKIDDRISMEAELLKLKLDGKPEPLPPYERRIDAFVEMIDLPIGNIDVSLHLPLPIHSSTDIRDKRKYRIPWIGEVEDAAISYIRAVAYEPIIEIDEENQYDMAVSRPNDIDFVTVEAKFDVAGLYGRFYDSFAGDDVEQKQWRDPCLAIPVFSAVQLQRQELGADGSWSQWQIVPRTKIELRKKMFESVEEVEDLPPGGIKVRRLQFDDAEVRMALLQPEAYKIASAKEEWFPPSLHKKYVEQQNEIEVEKKRRAKEEEKLEREEEREKAREERGERRGRTTGTGLFGGQSGGRRGDSTRREGRLGTNRTGRDRRSRNESLDTYGGSGTSSRRREREERAIERQERLAELRATSRSTTIDDIYKELDDILITKKTNLMRMRDLLLFWAHDDTVEPGKSYRYRIRLGVFNPIAGTNRFNEQDEDLKNKIVLWSEFSELKEIVKVPGTLYFFPRDVKDAARVVTVHVARYTLGYWYVKDFAVKPGEVIGKVAEFEPAEDERNAPMMPETIDYTTGAVMVDVVPVNDWSGGRNMYARRYYDMLYSFDGGGIEHRPVSTRYWDDELRIKLNDITRSQKEPKEPLRPWDSKLTNWQLAPGMGYRNEGRIGTSRDRQRGRTRESRYQEIDR